jgi:hypothetical protein
MSIYSLQMQRFKPHHDPFLGAHGDLAVKNDFDAIALNSVQRCIDSGGEIEYPEADYSVRIV